MQPDGRKREQSPTCGVVGRCPPKDIDEVMICLGEGVVTLDWFLVAIKYEQHASPQIDGRSFAAMRLDGRASGEVKIERENVQSRYLIHPSNAYRTAWEIVFPLMPSG